LALELQGLLEMNLDFDIAVTGFEMGEIDLVIGSQNRDMDDVEDRLPKIDPALPLVTSPGDLWQFGGHRLSCCRPTMRSNAAILASYPCRRSAAWASSSKAPASYL
jgi:hypothetical protein